MTSDNIQSLEQLKAEATTTIRSAATLETLEEIKTKYLGRKGKVNELTRSLSSMSPQKREDFGRKINEVKQLIKDLLSKKEFQLKQHVIDSLSDKTIDVTEPGIPPTIGHLNPITLIQQDVAEAFQAMGYAIEEGPEIETDHYNFEVLNIPKTHPARDLQDTFWLTNGLVPRTHTSAMQVRFMEKHKPPFKVAVPGWVYRSEREDATHAAYFHQTEAFAVAETISFADLKGTLFALLSMILGRETKLKFRASYFPYVEPCAEVSATCPHCKGNGCSVCSQSGWIEILGSGMIHPVVLKNAGIDPTRYSGFAFAFGTTRLAMIKYRITDIRLFTGKDVRFLRQF